MKRPIDPQKLSDLWWEEFRSPATFADCILCGGKGVIDTRGKVTNALGVDCGGQAFCICPTGRVGKRETEKALRDGR